LPAPDSAPWRETSESECDPDLPGSAETNRNARRQCLRLPTPTWAIFPTSNSSTHFSPNSVFLNQKLLKPSPFCPLLSSVWISDRQEFFVYPYSQQANFSIEKDLAAASLSIC